MSIEARYKLFGLPIAREELFPLDGELPVKLKPKAQNGDLSGQSADKHTVQALSRDSLAVFPYSEHLHGGWLDKGEPQVLSYENINQVEISPITVRFRGVIIPFLTGKIVWSPNS